VNIRKYTRRNLKQSKIQRFFQNLSITNWIILINVVVFAIFYIILIFNENAISYIALQPLAISQGKNLWTIITSMFMHGSFTHLLVNMISLLFIGNFVEKIIGRKRYLTFYLLAGIIASIFFIIFGLFTAPETYAVGASGAIFGLGGLLALLTPKLPVLVFFIIPMPMWLAMVFLMFGLWLVSWAAGLPIGNIAHLGGLLVGLGYGFYLKRKYPKKTQMISRYFSR
jgi:hypothetical protein